MAPMAGCSDGGTAISGEALAKQGDQPTRPVVLVLGVGGVPKEAGEKALAELTSTYVVVSALGIGGAEVIRSVLLGDLDNAERAVLVVDAASLEASSWQMEALRDCAQLASAFGLFSQARLVVLVAGLPSDAKARLGHFEEACEKLREMLHPWGFDPVRVPFLPFLPPELEPTTEVAERLDTLTKEPSLAAALRDAGAVSLLDASKRALRMPVQELTTEGGSVLVAHCQVESGVLRRGSCLALPAATEGDYDLHAQRWYLGDEGLEEARPGDTVKLVGVSVVERLGGGAERPGGSCQAGLKVGTVLSLRWHDQARQCKRFRGLVAIVATRCARLQVPEDGRMVLDVHAASVPCRILETSLRRGLCGGAGSVGGIVEVWIEPLEPVCLETFGVCPPLGRFALRNASATWAAGLVDEVIFTTASRACFDDD